MERENESGSAARGGLDRPGYSVSADYLAVSPRADMDLVQLWGILWGRKWLILAITAGFAFASVTYALLAPEWYRAQVVLIPADQQAPTGLAAQFGGIASLAGINVGGGGSVEPVSTLRSLELARRFIEENDLLTVLLADEWDPEAKRWVNNDPEKWPDIRDAVKAFDESVRTVDEDITTGLVTLSVEWTDAALAAAWANKLVDFVNERMRQRALDDAERNVKFLSAELSRTSIVALQSAIAALLETEMQRLMLAHGRSEFAFRVIDHAETPKFRSQPKRAFIAVVGTLLGGILAVVIVLVSHLSGARLNPPERRTLT